ncbi:hypothetical protein [Bacillus luti]|uniref:hypothetical protein n=1 Tax=Bacillus luti TaxID=2026191 RepID=UPI0012E70E68|nr:hypothetical protein [Bacillus luti]
MSYWHFPSVSGGNINSINDAGLEIFRGNAINALAREVIQNVLDAIKDKSEPVTVDFSYFMLEDFPEEEEIYAVFNKCRETWEGKNKKSEDFSNQALSIIKQKQIPFLRISDFNTKGLEGAKTAEIGSPWSSLIKESGSSNKGDSSGGSFGIGKAAPFLVSDIRTLFYSSYAIDGYKSHIGVSNIMSFQKENDEITLGKGYYTNDNCSNAIEGLLNLDPSFQREEIGTDIYVASFNPKGDWKEDIKYSVVNNFFITIYEKKLIVTIDGFTIDDKNIGELISKLDDTEENRVLKNYYKLLESDKVRSFLYPAKKYKDGSVFANGEAELYLVDGEGLNRRVLMTRETGMHIYEQKNVSGSISFTGLLRITGENMNKVFKEMENPAHNEWEPKRCKDPKLAEKILKDLRKFIRSTVRDTYIKANTDVMDAVGLSDFLPNKSLLLDSGVEERESISSRVKSIKFSKKIEGPSKKKPESKKKSDIEQLIQLVGAGEEDLVEQGNEITDKKGHFHRKKEEREVKTKKTVKSVQVSSQHKYLCTDKLLGKYRFQIIPNQGIRSGKLEFTVIGEQSELNLPIKNAFFTNESVIVESISTNTVIFKSKNKNKVLELEVEIDYSEYCAMGVAVYENK